MASGELQPEIFNSTVSHVGDMDDDEEAQPTVVGRARGGWITFPFITVGILGLTVAASGWLSNLIVYLIEQFNIKSIDAAQISNIVNGCTNFLPIAGAILADSSFGNFAVVNVSSIISLLGMVLLCLTASIPSLRPAQCVNGSLTTSTCETPSTIQYAVLYTAITLASLGIGGTRFTIATMGADQFEKQKHQASFFNWYFFTLYLGYVIGSTVLVYIQDNVGWNWGLGLSLAANAIGFIVFLVGSRYYRCVKPSGSPFMSVAHVVVAATGKRKICLSSEATTYYNENTRDGKVAQSSSSPTLSLRFLNHAAIKCEGDVGEEGTVARPWKLCTVQQVEDLKALLKILPLWSTGVFLSIPIGIQSSLVVLQALSMDRHIGSHFNVPAGSFLVSTLISTAIFLTFMDRFLLPTYQRLMNRNLTPLQRVGVGHVLNIVGMAASAIVEAKRLHVARSHNLAGSPGGMVVPMSALWLVGPLAIVGIGEAFHFPGQVSLYYQEFPKSLRSTSTAMISMLVALGYYLSTALIGLVRRVTKWLPDDINEGRLDNVFWLLVVIGVINFSYYLTCSLMYKYQNIMDDGEKSAEVHDVSINI
ncbi:hypothetical protein MKX01_036674 [Papaver californicum]|nr:hypothetical protein MKX01_036674 [Papaver californicum]